MHHDHAPPRPAGPTHPPGDFFPELVRVNYFHGQMLGARDFRAEQAYLRAKLRLMNRCLHGCGVVCGLDVTAEPPPKPDCVDPEEAACRRLAQTVAEAERAAREADPQDLPSAEARLEELRRRYETECRCHHDAPRSRPPLLVRIGPGFALDPLGNELLVRTGIRVDLREHLSPAERERLAREGCVTVWLSLCYQECGFERVAVAAMDACRIAPGCMDARIREGVRLRVSLTPPLEDPRCEPCCESPADCCVLLAAIRVTEGELLTPGDIETGVRRPFGLYAPTVITGISWQHGATYTSQGGGAVLAALAFRFSRGVLASTVRPGVLDVWIIRGGRGYAGAVQNITGGFRDLPAKGFVDRLVWKADWDELPQRGDRILIVVRCDFLLDACCRPVDGNHVGGMAPILQEGCPPEKRPDPPEGPCARMPGTGGPWTSGNGQPGGSFESWFFIDDSKGEAAP